MHSEQQYRQGSDTRLGQQDLGLNPDYDQPTIDVHKLSDSRPPFGLSETTGVCMVGED